MNAASRTAPADDSRRAWAGETAVILVSALLRSVSQFVVVWLLAVLTDQSAVGRYALIIAIATPLFTVAQMGLRSVYLSHFREFTLRSYIAAQLLVIAAAFIVSLGVAWLFDPGLVLLAGVVGVMKAADALAEPFSGVLQRYQSIWLILLGNAAIAILGTGLAALALTATGDLTLAIAALALVSVLATALALALPAIRLSIANGVDRDAVDLPRALSPILRAGMPIGIALGLMSLVVSAPQYVVGAMSGDAALGHLAVLVYGYAIADMANGAISLTWITRAQASVATAPSRPLALARLTARTVALGSLAFLALGAAGVAAMWFAVPPLFGEEYALTASTALALLIAVVTLPAAHFTTVALYVGNKYAHSLSAGAVGAVAATLGAVVLVPSLGIAGALLAMAVANLARGVTAFLVVRYGRDAAADA